MSVIISGIQQVGIGIPDVHAAWTWYRKHFEIDVPIFEEAAEANLMLPYTGGKPHARHAILALSMQGGGGFEIWQYTSRTPQLPDFEVSAGDLGIFVCKIKCHQADAAYAHLKSLGADLPGTVMTSPDGMRHFFVKDPYGNWFNVTESKSWFSKNKAQTGGVGGVIIGVSDMNRALKFYAEILGYQKVLSDETGVFEDFKVLPGGDRNFRRVKITTNVEPKGAFSALLGSTEIELIQLTENQGRRIFENRFWGDRGFIHLCFDINGMAELKAKCESAGHPFTVDSSNSFDMGEAAGHFSYIEDPDGTLIEFVETHKIPILKKIGWYLDLRKRNPEKPLPVWMLKALSLNRKKN
jgi:catechol 2,3-dioxygenase-like lactoylglutathione lyase family enzyme